VIAPRPATDLRTLESLPIWLELHQAIRFPAGFESADPGIITALARAAPGDPLPRRLADLRTLESLPPWLRAAPGDRFPCLGCDRAHAPDLRAAHPVSAETVGVGGIKSL
jgi:hypothetical protein